MIWIYLRLETVCGAPMLAAPLQIVLGISEPVFWPLRLNQACRGCLLESARIAFFCPLI